MKSISIFTTRSDINEPLELTAKGPASCPRVLRGLVCNTIRTATWVHPEKCECVIAREREERCERISKRIDREKHLRDVEFVNQNRRDK